MLFTDKKYQLAGSFNPPIFVNILSDKSLICHNYPFYCEFLDPTKSTFVGDFFSVDGIGKLYNYRLEEVPIWKDWAIDQVCYVKAKENRYDREYRYLKRHFAGINKDGLPTIFSSGKTSWSHSKELPNEIVPIPHEGSTYYFESLHASDLKI